MSAVGTAPAVRLDGTELEPPVFLAGAPAALFARLRREAPVAWYPWRHGRGYWCVTRHADVVAVHKDPATFSSETGGTALEDLEADQIAARKSMLDMDRPGHTRLRQLVNPPFGMRAVLAYEVLLRELTRAILDRALARDELDFVAEIAKELPIVVLARLLGAPPQDTDRLVAWGDRMIGNSDPELADVLLESPESEAYRLLPFRSPAAVELFAYGHELAARRRAQPAEDLVTKLALAEIDGQRLTEREFDAMFLLLVVAGNETTRQAIALGMLALLEHPDQWARLRADPGLMPTAVDEILRWASPVLHFRRTATRDAELAGQRIGAGDKVVTWYVSANQDEAVFAEPLRFDVGRSPNPHLTFGGRGPHTCLGLHLAKLEVKVMFEELLPRLAGMELAGPAERLQSNFTHGLKRMPVRVRLAG